MKNGFIIAATAVFVVALIFGCGENLTEEQMYARALDYENKEQWGELAETYEQLVKKFPESPKADEYLYRLGMIYANNLKEFEKSVQAYRDVIERFPESKHVIQAKFMIGYRFANDIKDLDKAREAYESFLAEYPDHELTPSVKWELDHLGQDISDIELQLGDDQAAAAK